MERIHRREQIIRGQSTFLISLMWWIALHRDKKGPIETKSVDRRVVISFSFYCFLTVVIFPRICISSTDLAIKKPLTPNKNRTQRAKENETKQNNRKCPLGFLWWCSVPTVAICSEKRQFSFLFFFLFGKYFTRFAQSRCGVLEGTDRGPGRKRRWLSVVS